MNQWAFVIGAYALTLLSIAALFAVVLAACRRAEGEAERLGRRQ